MKKLFGISVLVIMAISIFSACTSDTPKADLWGNALYSTDAELGAGSKTVSLEVIAEERSVTFSIKTDKDNLEDALTEHSLISGEKGPYGLYVKYVNGIEADYDKNRTYWSLSKNDKYMSTGVGETKIANGEKYEFTYMKQEG